MIDQTQWVLSDALLTPPNGLDVGWRAHHPIADLVGGQTYSLTFEARNGNNTGSCLVEVTFRKADGGLFRSYSFTVRGTTFGGGVVKFRAPEFAEKASVVITTTNTRTYIKNIALGVAATPIVDTEPTVFSASSYPPTGYKLAFNDEFQGNTLNREKWHTRLIENGGNGQHLNDEIQRYRDNHSVSNGFLTLSATKQADGTYSAGMIRSDRTFGHGFFEIRVKMPKGKGVWPALWLRPDVGASGELSWPPEIDIFEFVVNGVEETPNKIHSGTWPAEGYTAKKLSAITGWNETWTYYRAPFDFTDGWHTIGLEWLEDKTRFFIDGKQINARECHWLYEGGAQAAKPHLILNYAVGGAGWAGKHGVDDVLGDLQVAYIRYYTK